VAQEQLITIDLNPEERRLWDRLRSRVVTPKARLDGSGIGDLLVLLPDLTVLAVRLLRDERVPLVSKAAAVAGIAYVLSPLDFMPVLLFGPIGLVDDLVIIASVLSGMLNRVHPDVVRSHWSGQGDALDVIQRVTAWVEEQTTSRILRMLSRFVSR
jgi:uncharacterized membrane protein YkvA (DUF1232 family)